MAKTADQIASKWVNSMQNASTAAIQGVAAVTENPMEKAAAAQDRYQSGVAKAVANGKYADGCRSVSLSAWQQAFKTKGAPRMAEGAVAAKPMVTAFHQQHQVVAQQSSDEAARARADGSMDGRARMNRNYDLMSGFRFQKPRR